MATVPGANQMMAPAQLAGSGSSGYGVTLSGFFCPNAEFGARLKELDDHEGPFQDMDQIELNGYILFLAGKKDPSVFPEKSKVATFRREPHKFFIDLPRFLYGLKAASFDRIAVSGSLGSICLSILYHPAPDAPRS